MLAFCRGYSKVSTDSSKHAAKRMTKNMKNLAKLKNTLKLMEPRANLSAMSINPGDSLELTDRIIGQQYNYFKAEYLGWNGSRSRVIAEVSGCWDTEDDAEDALNERVDKVRQDWYDRAGQDADTADDTHGGWLSDYKTFTYRFSVTPTVNGRLDHDRSLWLNPGELPEWKSAE